MNKSEAHQFTLFYDSLSEKASVDKELLLDDEALAHRIATVLRLKESDECILFDRTMHSTVRINAIKKRTITVFVLSKKQNVPLLPSIKLLLPVLKKDALAQALYNAVEAGANEIQLIYTHKTASNVATHDLQRLDRIAIAAAEQAKHFAIPIIHAPVPFEHAIQLHNQAGIFFDPAGSSVASLHSSMMNNKSFCLLVGPEGDLTHDEKRLLQEKQWIFCALTPTILRASQAVSVGIGLWRSLFR